MAPVWIGMVIAPIAIEVVEWVVVCDFVGVVEF